MGWIGASQPGGIRASLTTIASSSVGLGEDCHYQVVPNQTIETVEPVFFDCNVFTLLHLNSNGLPATQRSYNGECRIKIMNGNYYGIENIYQFERIPQLHKAQYTSYNNNATWSVCFEGKTDFHNLAPTCCAVPFFFLCFRNSLQPPANLQETQIVHPTTMSENTNCTPNYNVCWEQAEFDFLK